MQRLKHDPVDEKEKNKKGDHFDKQGLVYRDHGNLADDMHDIPFK